VAGDPCDGGALVAYTRGAVAPRPRPIRDVLRNGPGRCFSPSLGELSRLEPSALALSDEVDLGDRANGLRAFLNSAAQAVAAGQASGTVRSALFRRIASSLRYRAPV